MQLTAGVLVCPSNWWTRTAVLLGLAVSACSNEAPARAQLVVVIDTNAPLPAQVATDDTLSPDAAIDTVRIDIVGDDGSVVDFLDVVAPGPLDWPISFGVEAADGRQRIRLRIRAFSGRRATSGELDGKTTLEPTRQITIDRLADIDTPTSGKRIVRILLDEDCLGRPATFLAPRTTCVDGTQIAAPPDVGIETVGDEARPQTDAGTWSGARYVPCTGSATSNKVCIPGGFAIMGDPDTVGLDRTDFEDAWPPLPVRVSPFWMDKTELTVKSYKQLVASGSYTGVAPVVRTPNDPSAQECSWLGTQSTDDDDLALTCIDPATAEKLCEARGGTLPSEAQWEYAARGRGHGWQYPWGDAPPHCCTASLSRHSIFPTPVACDGSGPEPVGSHAPSKACDDIGDVSLDGVEDLAGGVAEFTSDSPLAYDDPCWGGPGIVQDPHCHSDQIKSTVARGGDYTTGFSVGSAPLRRFSLYNETGAFRGVRCVYPDGV